jgi:transposase
VYTLPPRRGEDSPNAGVDNRTAKEIRDRYQDGGVTMRQLAGEYGVSRQTIHNIVHSYRYGDT